MTHCYSKLTPYIYRSYHIDTTPSGFNANREQEREQDQARMFNPDIYMDIRPRSKHAKKPSKPPQAAQKEKENGIICKKEEKRNKDPVEDGGRTGEAVSVCVNVIKTLVVVR
jgi:hypothetical protein